jgi:hypothetical protein
MSKTANPTIHKKNKKPAAAFGSVADGKAEDKGGTLLIER